MNKRQKTIFTVLSIALVVLFISSVCIGSVKISVSETILSIFKSENVKSSTAFIVKNIRIPRSLGAVCIGICLAVSGLVFQTVFRNPMADSYVLGISSSSSFFVCLVSIIGLGFNGILPLSAFIGSCLCALYLFISGHKRTYELLLKGVALNFLLSAATTLLLYISRKQLDTVIFWTMGSLNSINPLRALILLTTSIIALVFALAQSPVLDILLLDESTSYSSGLDTEKTRMLLIIFASLITSVCVSFAGIIGFVGLMSPHFIKEFAGNKHRNLIILSSLLGADIMLFSDIISRLVIAPSELPIGIVTSILGAPVFITLLRRKNHD